jgi:hypothetical protein
MPCPILQPRIKDLIYIHLALLPYYVAEMLSQGGMGQPYLNLLFEFCRCVVLCTVKMWDQSILN